MAAGTLSVTNNSKAVVGVGTTFTAFNAGDFLSLVVGQVPYTVAIASVESDTALTLVLPFDGPTAAGLAWDGVKRDTMSLATMGVTVQAQKALRLMLADENNWRAIFGDAEEITVTLPNGQVMQGMSWGYLSQLMKEIDPVEMRNLQQQAAASEAAAQGFRNEAEGIKNTTAGIRDATDQIKTETQAIHDATNTIKTQTDQIKTETQAIKTQTDQIKTETQAIHDATNIIKTQTDQIKTDTQAIKDQTEQIKTDTGVIRDEAEQFKNEIDPSRFLAKASNLSDVADVAEARTNLDLDRFKQSTIDTTILEPSGAYTFFVASSDWGYYNSSTHERAALPVQSGGTGGTTTFTACRSLRAMNYDHTINTLYASPELDTGIGFYSADVSQWPGGNGGPYTYAEIMTIAEGGGGPGSTGNWSQIGFSTITNQAPRYRQRTSNPALITNWRDFLIRDLNTTVDSNGFIKIASPIVKIKGDGTAEFNDESKGCSVTRVSKGVYVISGCLGLNSDASWGGVNGGFEIPVDVNKQPLLWLDYAVLNDGSIEIRTYHRTHTNAPAFARNIMDGIEDGDPVDIPPSTYISVRVQMPETGLETATSSA
ncbi:tail fibers protein [Acinetobacter phage NJ01]|nr:tail fibers protein [Acinetobacter phage NJ01]